MPLKLYNIIDNEYDHSHQPMKSDKRSQENEIISKLWQYSHAFLFLKKVSLGPISRSIKLTFSPALLSSAFLFALITTAFSSSLYNR